MLQNRGQALIERLFLLLKCLVPEGFVVVLKWQPPISQLVQVSVLLPDPFWGTSVSSQEPQGRARCARAPDESISHHFLW